jgi:DNA uptake protein ComE-like DNA-binding protein
MKQAPRKLAAAAATLLMALALATCGGATQPASTATQVSAPTSAPAAEQPTSAAPAAEPTAAGDDSAPTSAAAPTDASQATAMPAESATAQPAASAKLNLNEVTEDQLLNTIPNFGNRMVREFFEYRPYVSIQQFRREIGKYVDADQVAEYEKYVYVPVDVDASDAETLQQLPGIDATIAATLIASRPYGSNQAFLTKLGEQVSAGDLAAAEAYLVAK